MTTKNMKNFNVTLKVEFLNEDIEYTTQQFEEFLDWMFSNSDINPENPLFKAHIESEIMIAQMIEYTEPTYNNN